VLAPALSGVVWNLREIKGTTPATPPDPSAYTLTFDGAGSVAIRADCNQGSAGYEVDGNGLSFAPALMTRVACPPESLYDLYVQSLEAVVSYTFADGDLVLGLSDGSTMIFSASIIEPDQATPTAG
jgi:heat shock protein HslJ